jgi:hypothetical protein
MNKSHQDKTKDSPSTEGLPSSGMYISSVIETFWCSQCSTHSNHLFSPMVPNVTLESTGDFILRMIKTGATHIHFTLIIITIVLFLMKNPNWVIAIKCSLAALLPAIGIKPVGLLKHDMIEGGSSSVHSSIPTASVKGSPSKVRPASKKEN